MKTSCSNTRILIVDDDEEDFLITSDYISQIEDHSIQLHWIKERIADGSIHLEFISTNKQSANGLINPVPRVTFEQFHDALRLERSWLHEYKGP